MQADPAGFHLTVCGLCVVKTVLHFPLFKDSSFKDHDVTFGALFQLPLFAYGVRQGRHR